MGLAVRTFLCSFVPLMVLLSGGFCVVERVVASIVHDALRLVLRDNQASFARVQQHNEQLSKRYLRMIGENASLKAGLQLLLAEPNNADARFTVEDQLSEISSTSQLDLLFIARPDGSPLAGIVRKGKKVVPMTFASIPSPTSGMYVRNNLKYLITSVPVEQSEEIIALLSVGEELDFRAFNTPVVLLHRGKVVESSLPGVSPVELNRVLPGCHSDTDCELTLAKGALVSVAGNVNLGDGYSFRSLVNLDATLTPLHATIRHIFVTAGVLAFVVAIAFTWVSSRVVVDPIARVIDHLRESEGTGTLQHFDATVTAAPEIRELMVRFNSAAAAIRGGQNNLHSAYLEFVQSLASALDARDPYTAGHSGRVCRFSCAIAQAMIFDREELRKLGIGALLHDIGKIGIPDTVLQKPGRLTQEEFELIKKHPVVGRRILEAVHGFAPYLDVVELHHENWDGSGYPHGLRGEEVPIGARIVHVADAYDAMTSDRPYRPGLQSEVALRILQENSGTQFDPAVVEVFVKICQAGEIDSAHSGSAETYEQSLLQLAGALSEGYTQSIRQTPLERKTA